MGDDRAPPIIKGGAFEVLFTLSIILLSGIEIMPDEIRIDVSLKKSEIAFYNFFHIRWLLTLDVLGLIGLIIMTVYSIYSPSPEVRNTLNSLLIWAVLLLAFGFSQPLILFMQIYILKNPAMLIQTARRAYRFSDEGIHIISDGKSVLTSWNKITAVKDIGRLILIFTSPKLAYVIPRRCFLSSEDLTEFSNFIMKRIRQAN